MRPRIAQELALLRQQYGEVEHTEVAGDDWFKLPRYHVSPGWRIGEEPVEEVSIAFFVTAAHPEPAPYGFLGPSGLNFSGATPGSTGKPPKTPPFEGDWLQFSWSVENWAATNDVQKGSNLLAWCRNFTRRFEEGA